MPTLSSSGSITANYNPPGISVMPSPQAPITQGKTGQITPVWWAFLQTLYQKVGSNVNLNLGQVATSISSVASTASAANVASGQAQISSSLAESIALQGLFFENNGALAGSSRTVNIMGGTFALDSSGVMDLSVSAGLESFTDGTITLSGTEFLIGQGLTLQPAPVGNPSALNTIAASGLTFLQGTTSLEGLTLSAGANISLSGTSGGTITIAASGSGSSSGTLGIEYNGTLYPTLAAGSNITFSPGTGSTSATLSLSTSGGTSTSGLEINDGTQTLNSLAILTVHNLALTNNNSAALVQTNQEFAASSIALSSPSTTGNVVLLMINSRDGITTNPPGWTLQSSYSAGTGNNYVFSKNASGTTESVNLSAVGGRIAYTSAGIFEVSGSSGFEYYTGLGTYSSPNITYTLSDAIGTNPSVLLTAIAQVNVAATTPTTPLPSGSTILSNGGDGTYYDVAYLKSGTLTSVASPTVGITTSTGSPSNVVVSVIKFIGPPPGAASAAITPNIPFSLNGTASGAFENLAITTGNAATSVSLTSGTLVINLGTP